MIAILASGAGALLAWASTVQELPTPPADSVIRELDAWDAPPPLPYVWSPTALDWVVPADPTRKLTRLEFRWRYTLAEQVAVEVAEREHADVTDPRTVQGVQYHASIGLIAPARVAEILAAP